MRQLILSLALLVGSILSGNAQNEWKTYYEQHNYNKTSRYDETIEFSKKLADESTKVDYHIFGYSHQGKEIPVLIFDAKGNFSPETVKKSGNKIILIQAAIHPGEPVGKDAGLLLFRDIVIHGKFADVLDDITILFIPVLNPDGLERFGPYNRINQNGPEEMGWRTNALNLNLNRDYLKADTREIRAFLELWNSWQPDFFIDTHSTNGGDYQYPMTYAISTSGDSDKNLVSWISEDYIPVIEEKMKADGFPVFPYVTYRSWHDPQSGLVRGVGHPMYSNSYISQVNRPGLLLETHMLKPYKIRVESTYMMIVHTLKLLHSDDKLTDIIQAADEYTASEAFRSKEFPLRYQGTSDSIMIDFLGVKYTVERSSISGGKWFIYDSENPVTFNIPLFNQHEVTHAVSIPDAYIIPKEYEDIIERLNFHGVQMTLLDEEKEIEVESYCFRDVRLSGRSIEGHQTATFTVDPIKEIRRYAKGSAIIPVGQARARLIIHALEPMAPGSFAYWGFFNSIFERVEYFESYAMERIARDMIAEDPMLMEELKMAMNENPSMADNPNLILSWFYERTPYYDQRHNIYPIGRIFY